MADEAPAGIERSSGSTKSERKLADLADKTFLDLWSYPNLYKDKLQHGKGQGKELCDLLVVFGDDIIIFSDKEIKWQSAVDTDLAWSRWYRAAIDESTKQIGTAVSWLTHYDKRVFLDKFCKVPLPIDLPPPERRRFHGVVVANGATEACREYCNDESGSFLIVPDLKGKDHTDRANIFYKPFFVGDVNPSAPFIHVFDSTAIDLLLKELDTVTEFIAYLNGRESFIRSGSLIMAPGEEDLLGYYLTSRDKSGRPDFFAKFKSKLRKGVKLSIARGMYQSFISEFSYYERSESNRISYAWDKLIGEFTKNVIAGTSHSFDSTPTSASLSEQGLRFMAREPRLYRRTLARQLLEAFKIARQTKATRFARVVLPDGDSDRGDLAYLFLVFPYDPGDFKGGYAEYREVRVAMLSAYSMSVLVDHPNLKYTVALAFDGYNEGRKGGSEDCLVLEQGEFSDDVLAKLEEHRKELNIYQGEKKFVRFSDTEFPSSQPPDGLSRQQRRAMERANRKRR